MEAVQKVSHKLAEEVYKATASQQTAGAGAQQEGGADAQASGAQGDASSGESKSDDKEDIIDADFKAEDDK